MKKKFGTEIQKNHFSVGNALFGKMGGGGGEKGNGDK